MGATQSYITAETAVTALVVAGAVGLGYQQINSGSSNQPSSPPDKTEKQGKKKNQPAKHTGPSALGTAAPVVVPPPTILPGQFDALSSSGAQASRAAVTSAAKKGKKKKQSEAVQESGAEASSASQVIPTVVPAPTILPGQFEGTGAANASEAAPSTKPKKGKKKKGKSAAEAAAAPGDYHSDSTSAEQSKPKTKRQQQTPSSSALLTKPLKQSTISVDTDSSWTRVEARPSRRPGADGASAGEGHSAPSADLTTSDAGLTTSVTGNSSPVAERTDDEGLSYARDSVGDNRRPLAERLLPKPRKTGVDDMLETPDYPSLSRVMRVQPLPNEKPASGFSWGDYEDVRVTENAGNDADGEDDGWGVVKSKSRTKIDRSPSSSQSQVQKTSDALTKKQRQNANKRDAQKSAKNEAEAERLAILSKHQRELERVKMAEQLAGKGGGK